MRGRPAGELQDLREQTEAELDDEDLDDGERKLLQRSQPCML